MIYFDYNGAHPPIRPILEKSLELYFEKYGNPSGISSFSQTSQGLIERSRTNAVGTLSMKSSDTLDPKGFHFCSSGTEAIYQLIRSFAEPGATVVLSPYEHPALYAACEDRDLDIHILSASRSGLVDPDELNLTLLRITDTGVKPAFFGCIAVSNETGVIQPVKELAEICRSFEIPFLSDTIQAVAKIDVDFALFDGFVLNGIKFGAGPGASAVYVRPPHRATPIFRGGLQEDERRAGTENLFAILNFDSALAHQFEHLDEKNLRLGIYQHGIERRLREDCGAVIIASESTRTTNTTFAVFPGIEDFDFFIIGIDLKGAVISTGSSCKSRARKPSKVLMDMGYSEYEAGRSIRISSGLFTDEAEVDRLTEILHETFRSLEG
jgi:cysteine desulfurase